MTPDILILRELHFVGRHGLLPVEMEREQPFTVSLQLETPLDVAAHSDRLEDTVDYRVIQGIVRNVIEGSHKRLIETLAEGIAAAVLTAAPKISAVTVELTKPRPPVDFQFAGVTAKIRRERTRPPAPRTAFISLGSNLGDRATLLHGAIQRIGDSERLSVVAQSAVTETAPMGVVDQPQFLNQVIAVATTLSPEELLGTLLRIEAEYGRVRTQRWGPRTLDLDLLVFEGETRRTVFLELPHPRMLERSFVTEPLRELLNLPQFSDWSELRDRLRTAG